MVLGVVNSVLMTSSVAHSFSNDLFNRSKVDFSFNSMKINCRIKDKEDSKKESSDTRLVRYSFAQFYLNVRCKSADDKRKSLE